MQFTREYLLLFDTIQVRYYGLIVVAAMVAAAYVATRIARRVGLDPDHIWGGLTWAIVPGIVLARLWYVVFPPISATAGCGIEGGLCMDLNWMIANIGNLDNGPLAIWSGGLSIFGAILGGFFGVFLYARRHKLDLLEWMDIAAIVIPLAQAIGRWANFINQELYGTPTTLPWGIPIDSANRVGEYASLVEYPSSTLFHPIFLYESLWSLGAFFVLLWLFNQRRQQFLKGDFFLLFVMQYALIRFLLEFLRIEIALIPGTEINSSQAFTLLVFVVALIVFIARRMRGAGTYWPIQAGQKRTAAGAGA
jgi:phosphatidylglycerol---prolipoprotein diacylglyceryl transferase